MPYVSPLKVLQDYKLPVELKLDRETLRIARQALLAEIDLSPRQTVMLGKQEMTRNDILNLFDNFQAGEGWKYHEAIHAEPALLDFLTQYIIPLQRFYHPTLREPGFAHFIEPFYGEVFGNAYISLLEKPELERLNALFNLPEDWLQGRAKFQMESVISEKLRRVVSNLERLTDQYEGKTGIVFPAKKLQPFYDSLVIEVLNRLPESFTDLRYRYGMGLISAAYILWNNKGRHDSQYIVRQVEKLKGNMSLEHQVNHYWSQCSDISARQARNNTESTRTGSGGFDNPWLIIGLVIFVIRMIGMCNSCDRQSSRERASRYEYPTIESVEAPTAVEYDDAAPVSRSNSATERRTKKTPKVVEEVVPEKPKVDYFDPEITPVNGIFSHLDSLNSSRAYYRRSNIPVTIDYDQTYKHLKQHGVLERELDKLMGN